MAWVEASLPAKWHLDPSSRLVTTGMRRKLGGCPFVGGGAGSPSNIVPPGPRPTSVPSRLHLDSSSRLTTTDMADNWGLCPCGGGELGPHLTQFGDGRGLLLAKFQLDPFSRLATIDMERGLYLCRRRSRRSLRL